MKIIVQARKFDISLGVLEYSSNTVLIFGVISVSYFKGKFFYCNNPLPDL